MSDETKSPRSDLPGGDGSHHGQEPARNLTPENGESAPNRPSSQREEKTGAAHSRHNRASKGTGALLSRITGILRKAAEEAPGDPVTPAANALPEAEPRQPGAETAGEKDFLESLRSQPRQATGQLRIMVTGGPEDDGAVDEPITKPDNALSPDSPALPGNRTADSGDESAEAMPPRLNFRHEVTGQLKPPFTGVLRGTDGLSELRAEIEAEDQQAPSGPETGAEALPGVWPAASVEPDEEANLLDTLLRQQGSGSDDTLRNTREPAGGMDALAGLRSEAWEQEEQPSVSDVMKQMWGEPLSDVPTDAEEEARLEDRFAMLGGDEEPFVASPVAEAAPGPELSAAVPHFDDAVMFPEEHIAPPFVEPAAPAAVEPPVVSVQPKDIIPPVAFAAAEISGMSGEAAQSEPEIPSAPDAPRARGSKRSETIYEDLRQTLADEESSKRRRTGGLLHRITGSLRRTTDSLRRGKTGPVGQPELSQPAPEEAQIPAAVDSTGETTSEPDFSGFDLNDFSEELPTGSSLTSEELAALPEDALIAGLEPARQAAAMEPAEEAWLAAVRQEGLEEAEPVTVPAEEKEAAPAEPETAEHETVEPPRTVTGRLAKLVTGILGGQSARRKTTNELDISDEVVSGRLQRSMVTGPLKVDKTRELDSQTLQELEAEQQASAERMATEAAVPEEEIQEPQNRGITGQLRSFITGILRSSEPPGGTTGPLQTGDLPGSTVTESVDQGLPSKQRSTPRRTSDRRETFDAQSLRQNMMDTPFTGQPAQEVSEEELLRGLGITGEAANPAENADAERSSDLPQDRFGMMFGDDSIATAYSPSGETGGLEEAQDSTVSPEDEGIGELTSEDIWGSRFDQVPAETRPSEETIWYVPEEEGEEDHPRQTGSLFGDELTEDALISAYLSGTTGSLETKPETVAGMSASDLRAIALEDYGENIESAAPSQDAGEAVDQAPELEFDEAPVTKRSLWDRVTSLTVLQKILLAEVVLLVVLVPFLVFAALYNPKVESPAVVFPMPHALPEGIPYPTGLMLTGGWNFDLQKSTFVEGKWSPAGSEWLEGTEVRRVVALPWNKQTEAVVRTFQPGDPITLTMSNQDEVQYKIVSIERRASTEADFLADRKLSLVILLYDEESEDRWVITGER